MAKDSEAAVKALIQTCSMELWQISNFMVSKNIYKKSLKSNTAALWPIFVFQSFARLPF